MAYKSVLGSLLGEGPIPGKDHELAVETAQEMKAVHDEIVRAMSFPNDGEYHIRSVTKERYLDVAYGKTEDNAQIIGQTLNSTSTPNQRWKVTRTKVEGLPVIRLISPVSDPTRHLSVHADISNGTQNIVTHERQTMWIAIPSSEEGSFRIRPTDNANFLSLHNSPDWNVILAAEEEGDTPQKYHQLWSFVQDPYVK